MINNKHSQYFNIIFKTIWKYLCPKRILIWEKRTNRNIMSITFDDGPHSIYTKKVLNILKKNNVKATFFVLGEKVKKNPNLLWIIIREGHEIGIHSYTHDNGEVENYSKFKEGFKKTRELIEKHCDNSIVLYRPINGLFKLKNILWVFRQGFTTVGWSAKTYDWTKDNKMGGFKAIPGKIYLFHDKSEKCLIILERLLSDAKQKEILSVTISELIGIKE